MALSKIAGMQVERGQTIKLSRELAFQLGEVWIQPAARQVRVGRVSQTVEPRVMQVLIALARAEGEVVSRDELIERCWDGRIVGDNAIHRAVSKVRALGALAVPEAFRVETIAKVGYRLVPSGGALVAASRREAPRQPGAVEEAASPLTSRLVRRGVLAAGVAAVAAVSGAAWLGRSPASASRAQMLISRADESMRDGLPEAEAQGLAYLEQAVRLDPENPVAWGRLALANQVASEHSGPDQVSSHVSAARRAATRALSLDSDQADALAALALLPPVYGDWLAAEERMRAVLARRPDHLATQDALAFFHVGVGRVRDGVEPRRRLAARDPLHAGLQYKLIYALWLEGRVTEADQAADRAMALWPQHPGVWFARLWTLAFAGRPERALAHVRETGRPAFPPPIYQALEAAMTALVTGRPSDADTAVARQVALVASGPSLAINAVLICAGLGRVDDAFGVVDAYLLERGPLMASVRWRPGQVSVNEQKRRKTNMLFLPVTEPLRADARFASLVREIGLEDYWRKSGVVPDFRLQT